MLLLFVSVSDVDLIYDITRGARNKSFLNEEVNNVLNS